MSNERSRDFGGAQTQGSDQGERRDPGADALLELARLIGGQNDPFAPEAPKSESRLSESRSETRLSETRLGDVSRAAAASPAGAGRAPFSRTQDRSYEERSSERGAPSRREPDFSEPGVEPSRMARASAGFDFPEPPHRGDYPVAPRHAAVDERDYDDDHHAGSRGIPAYRRRRDEQAYEYADGEGDHGSDEHEDFDDGDEPGVQRRRPTKAIMAVLGLAVFGSAAAYGYRTMISAAPSGPAIIHADNSPTKITPMSDVKTGSGRIGDRIGEQLASRQEEPVDLGSSLRSAGASTTDVAPTAAPGDPRRVHTVPIRADQGTASSPDRPAPASRVAAAPPALAQSAAAPPAPRQTAAAPPVVPSPPLQRQAAVAPASAPPDTPAAAPVEGSGFVVQLLAVRSEEAAQTEYRRFQTKYSAVLSGRQPLIRRKDRGEQGTFFVAQVGPFGAKSDADQLCDALKSAGGGCYVYKY